MNIDPADGLPVDMVGPWARSKHRFLTKYIDAARGARKRFLPPENPGGASYIDLYCSYGRSNIEDTSDFIDGSPLVAYKAARNGGARFSEIHLSDLNHNRSSVACERIKALGGSARQYVGEADKAAVEVVKSINPYGLHFAFLDPYNLSALPFSTIATLARVRRMDILVHVSAMDLQRNLNAFLNPADTTLERFMPGWRDAVNLSQSQAPLRAALFEYWLNLIKKLNLMPARGIPLITNEIKNARLYWLVFISHSDFANDLWDDISSPGGQGNLFG